MPLTVRDGALLAAGLWFAAGATFFYKRKQTLPFKVAYFLAWPTLGSATILVMMPSQERMAQILERSGTADAETLRASRELTRMQLAKIKEAAGVERQHPSGADINKG